METLPPEILNEIVANLNLSEIMVLASQDRRYQNILNYLRERAAQQVEAEHATKTYLGIFKTYATQPNKYQLALQAYRQLLRGSLNSVTAVTFLYPELLLTIGLEIRDASVVAQALASHNLNLHSPLVYQVYLLASENKFFAQRLLQLLPQSDNRLSLLRLALQPDSDLARFLVSRNLTSLKQKPDYLASLYQFFIDFQLDFVWAQLPPDSKRNTVALANTDILTRRYLTTDVTGIAAIHAKAAVLANWAVLDAATYLLVLLDQTKAGATWQYDAEFIVNLTRNKRVIDFSQLIQAGLASGWNIISLLQAVFPSLAALVTLDQTKLLFMSLTVRENLSTFIAGYGGEAVENRLILDIAGELDFTGLVTLVKTTSARLRVELLAVLATKVQLRFHRDDLVDFTSQLADLVITGDDLAGMLAPWLTAALPDLANLLLWYQPDSAGNTQLVNFINHYLAATNFSRVNVVVFLIGGYYGYHWPGLTLEPFANSALAAYYVRKFYGKVDLGRLSQVVSGQARFGGINQTILRTDYNLIEL